MRTALCPTVKKGDAPMRTILRRLVATGAVATLASWLLPAAAQAYISANHNETLVRRQ